MSSWETGCAPSSGRGLAGAEEAGEDGHRHLLPVRLAHRHGSVPIPQLAALAGASGRFRRERPSALGRMKM